MQLVFWICAVTLGYTFAGYPLLMRFLARRRPRPTASPDTPPPLPSITVVIAAHNAERLIGERLSNLLDSDYPAERFDIIVASDGSTDATVAEASDFQRVRALDFPHRRGKPACLNDAIALATGELVVLTDVRQRFEVDALAQLAARFFDPEVGAVSGELLISRSGSGVGEGIGGYWKMERALRSDEAVCGSAVGCTGAIYAIRRSLYRAIPEDTLIDDVVIPMQVASDGSRVLFETKARAFDPQALDPHREHVRKRRTIGGNFQMLLRYPGWCLPWGHPLWWRLISHKYLRLLAPLLLLLCVGSNIGIAHDHPVYALALVAQSLFYLLAATGALFPKNTSRLLSLPAAFLFLNAMTLAGLAYYLKSGRRTGW